MNENIPLSYMKKFRKRLKNLRESKSLSQKQVANQANLDQSAICYLENGRNKNPTMSTLIGLSQALNCSIDYLCGLDNLIRR